MERYNSLGDTPMDELMHYGVKGMKWGVRKEKDPSDIVSKADKKLAKANMKTAYADVVPIRVEQMFNPKGISLETYNSLSTKPVTLKKGQEFARVTKRMDEKLRDLTFVSYDPEDKLLYRGVMPNVTASILPIFRKPDYEYTYKATQALRGPSEKERVDAFIKLLDTPAIEMKRGKTITGKEYLKKAGFNKEVKRMDTQQLGLRFYEQAISNGVMANSPMSQAYFKSLQAKGYNVVSDDNDRKILSAEPLIVLNPNGTLKKMSVRRLSQQEINKAQQTLKIAGHRDPKRR